MRTSTLPRSRALSEAAERQMRMWALRLQSQPPAEELRTKPMKQLIHPYLALSREAGVDGGQIARLVGEKCGWQVFDRELLDYMAEHYQLSRTALEYVDERTASWLHEVFGKWLDDQLVSQAEYVARLGRVVLLAAQHASTVFVGRGVQFILPREVGLSIRLIAPKKDRIERIMQRHQCGQEEAERIVDDTDKGRADFVRRYFHQEVADPHLYDLVINLAQIPRETAVDLIYQLIRWRSSTADHPAGSASVRP